MKALTVTRDVLARVLGVSRRTAERLEAAGVLRPVGRPKRGTTSKYNLAVSVPAYIAHRTAPAPVQATNTPRDAYYRTQAELGALKLARERRDVLLRTDVVEDGQATTVAIATMLRTLPARLLQAGTIDAAALPTIETIVQEAGAELAQWRTRLELLTAVGDSE